MENMELQVLENIQKFSWNFEDIKASLAEYTQKYVGLVVNNDNLKDMESTQREVGKLRTQVEKFRKETKKVLEEPAKLFDSQIKELQGIIADVEVPIKEQLQKYEDERIAKVEADLMEYARTVSKGDGLRDENFNLIISSKWTTRSAKKNQVREEIIAELSRMLQDQNIKDAAITLQKQKDELIIQLCQTTSEIFSLNTPVMPRDVQHLTYSAELSELSSIIKEYCQKRADVELEAAKVAAIVAQPAPVEQPVPKQTEQPILAVENKIEAPKGPSLYNIVLKFPTITVKQAQGLCNYIKSNGIACETVSREKLQ